MRLSFVRDHCLLLLLLVLLRVVVMLLCGGSLRGSSRSVLSLRLAVADW